VVAFGGAGARGAQDDKRWWRMRAAGSSTPPSLALLLRSE